MDYYIDRIKQKQIKFQPTVDLSNIFRIFSSTYTKIKNGPYKEANQFAL